LYRYPANTTFVVSLVQGGSPYEDIHGSKSSVCMRTFLADRGLDSWYGYNPGFTRSLTFTMLNIQQQNNAIKLITYIQTPFTMPQRNKNNYKPTLIHLMSFVDGVTYKKDQEFTQEQLDALTPGIIERWMKLRAYRTPDPGPDTNPTHCCSSSLEYWKKALSTTCLID
jgi:hypothetical protein